MWDTIDKKYINDTIVTILTEIYDAIAIFY